MWCAYDEGEVVHKFYICITTDYGREGWVSYKTISLLAQEYTKEGIFLLVVLTRAQPGTRDTKFALILFTPGCKG